MPFAVTFQIGPDQKASQVTIEDLNDDGQGCSLGSNENCHRPA